MQRTTAFSQRVAGFLQAFGRAQCRPMSSVPKHINFNHLEKYSEISMNHEISRFQSFQFDSENASSTAPSMLIQICNLVCQCFEDGDRRLNSLQIGIDTSLEQVITVVAMLIQRESSALAMSFFIWVVSHLEFKYSMRFYILSAESFLGHGNLVKAQELRRYMISNFAEIGKLKEAVDMVFEIQNQGLALNIHTLNWILRTATNLGAT